jgi:hypothetical protein
MLIFGKKVKKEAQHPIEPKATEPEPKIKEIVIISSVKEVNGYIEIIRTCEDKTFIEERETLIKKEQVDCIDRFCKPYYIDLQYHISYRYLVLIHAGIEKRYEFEREEDAIQLYSGLSKVIKKKEAKPLTHKKDTKSTS